MIHPLILAACCGELEKTAFRAAGLGLAKSTAKATGAGFSHKGMKLTLGMPKVKTVAAAKEVAGIGKLPTALAGPTAKPKAPKIPSSFG